MPFKIAGIDSIFGGKINLLGENRRQGWSIFYYKI